MWWFFLFWTPAYFKDQFGLSSDNPKAMALIATLYAIVTFLSIGVGYLPRLFTGKPAGYMIVFCICAVAYLVTWSVMKILVPRYKVIKV